MRALIAALFVSLSLLACALPAPSAPLGAAPVATGSPLPIPPEFVPTALPITPTYAGCYYTWATKTLLELSRDFNAALQALIKDPGGVAYAYGENCVYADGKVTFSAMETDFRIGIEVYSVRDEALLGDWIHKVMQIVLRLPRSEFEGPNPGRVDINFKQPDPAELFVSIPIELYRSQAQQLRGADLFRFFYQAP